MFSNKSIPTESAYIAEELIQSQALTDLERRCLVIKQTLKDGDFTLDEALHLYEVSKPDFESFIAKNIIAELFSTITASESQKLQVGISIKVITEVYKQLFSSFDKNSSYIIQHLNNLYKEVEEDKILL
jgi:hypothetical protein